MSDCAGAATFAEVQQRLRSQLAETISPLLQGVTRVALLEFPPHANVGDSAIWLGDIAYLEQQHGLRPAFTSDIYNYFEDPLRRALDGGTILITGGGNLGDIWQSGLDSKIRTLQDFPNTRIIQLPQSIHFNALHNLESYRRAAARHRAFTLLVRDEASYELAQKSFDCDVRLCPDLALWLTLPRATPPSEEILCLLRTDREIKDTRGTTPSLGGTGCRIVDWLEEPHEPIIGIERWLSRRVGRYPRRLARLQTPLRRIRTQVATIRLRRGCTLLSSGKVVVTDRLHGHILCVLMGIPHVVLDNSYGKVRGFYERWTKDCREAHFAATIDEALDTARALAATAK